MLTLIYVNEVFQLPEIRSDDVSGFYIMLRQIQKGK